MWSKFWDLGFPLCTRKKWLIFSIQFITCYYILIHFCKKFQNSTFHPKGGYWVRIQILMYPYSITTYYICVMNIWDRTYKIYLSYNNTYYNIQIKVDTTICIISCKSYDKVRFFSLIGLKNLTFSWKLKWVLIMPNVTVVYELKICMYL